MREIKFRGLSDNFEPREWFYGCLVNQGDKHFIIHEDIENMVIVDPETVGQYTGLKDKNGNEIYEGDILRYSDGEILGVAFDNKTAQFTTKTRWLWTIIDVCEIVGNIHDNPELLDGK